jgi:hypothetical protein
MGGLFYEKSIEGLCQNSWAEETNYVRPWIRYKKLKRREIKGFWPVVYFEYDESPGSRNI